MVLAISAWCHKGTLAELTSHITAHCAVQTRLIICIEDGVSHHQADRKDYGLPEEQGALRRGGAASRGPCATANTAFRLTP